MKQKSENKADMSFLYRLMPAFALLIISPLIAEFLLGDFNIRQLGYLAIFIPLYGASALFIREVARQTNRGWLTMILLAVVFGIVAEGLVNLTLFNPNYAGQHLLAYGFIPKIGTSFNYAVFIVVLHAVWSICTPIAIAEAIASTRAHQPWLKIRELFVVLALSILGLVATAVSTIKRFHFEASLNQYLSIIVIVFILIFIAFKIKSPHNNNLDKSATKIENKLSFWLVFFVSFLISSAFLMWFHYAPSHNINAMFALGVFLGLVILTICLFGIWIYQSRWTTKHTLAAAIGTIVTYGWFGLQRLLVSGHTAMGIPTTTIDIVGQVLLLGIILALSFSSLKRL